MRMSVWVSTAGYTAPILGSLSEAAKALFGSAVMYGASRQRSVDRPLDALTV